MFSRENAAASPSAADMDGYIRTPLWGTFCRDMRDAYQVEPQFEFSKCGMEFGWNMKFRKGRRSLCTVYPREGYFTVMVVIGRKERERVEEALPTFCDELRRIYRETREANGQKWLMIDLEDGGARYDGVKKLLEIRAA